MKMILDFPHVLRGLITFSYQSLLQTYGEQSDAKPQRGSHTAFKSALKFLVICIPHTAWMSNRTKQIQETKVLWSCLSLLHFSGFHANPFPKTPELKSASSRGHYSSQNISRGINNFGSHKVETVQLEQDKPMTRIYQLIKKHKMNCCTACFQWKG